MEVGLPDEDSDQAREGTLLHAYDANPELDRAVLKPYQVNLLRISADLDERVFERALEQFGVSEDEPYEAGRETELWAMGPDNEKVISGHCDLWRYWPTSKLLAINDKKFGYKVVTPAVANLQLRSYAVAGSQRWDSEHVVTGVIQPRLPFEERLTMAAYSRDDIGKSLDELTWILQAARQPNAPLVAGEEQCRYCKAKMLCPAYKEKYQAVAIAKERTIEECNDDQLDQILTAIAFAHHIEDQARDEARRRVADGRMPNYKLGKESEKRTVVDVRRAMMNLTLRGDISKSDVQGALSMSLGPVEEKVRLRKKCTWKEARDIVDETLTGCIETKTTKPSLLRK